MNAKEREFMPYVARNGCVDIRALRKAVQIVLSRDYLDRNTRRRLVIYHYKRLTDPDGDEIMVDNLSE